MITFYVSSLNTNTETRVKVSPLLWVLGPEVVIKARIEDRLMLGRQWLARLSRQVRSHQEGHCYLLVSQPWEGPERGHLVSLQVTECPSTSKSTALPNHPRQPPVPHSPCPAGEGQGPQSSSL